MRRFLFSLPLALVFAVLTILSLPSIPGEVASWGRVLHWVDGPVWRYALPIIGWVGLAGLFGWLLYQHLHSRTPSVAAAPQGHMELGNVRSRAVLVTPERTASKPDVQAIADDDVPLVDWLGLAREVGSRIRDQLDPPKGYVVSPAAQFGGVFLASLEQRTRVWATSIRRRLRDEAPHHVGAFDEAGPDLPPPHMLAAVIGKAEREDLIAFVDAKLAVLDLIVVAERKGTGAAHRALLKWLGEKIEQFQGLRAALDVEVARPVPTMATTDRIQTGFWHLEDEIVTRLQLEASEWIDYYDETPDWFHPGLTLVTSEQFGRLSRFIGYKAERLRHIKTQLS